MKETTLRTKAGTKWTFTATLDDLDFADDISLLSHRHGDVQSKSENRARHAGKLRLKINTKKTKSLRNNSQKADPIMIEGHIIEDVTEFTYLGANVTKYGNPESAVKARISKARGAFAA